MKYPKNCPHCHVGFASDFWENIARQAHDQMVGCPHCGSSLNVLFDGCQNIFVTSQFLQITLTPCDEQFAPQETQAVKIQNTFIKHLFVRQFAYGFEGIVKFFLPMRFLSTKIFEFVAERNPIIIEIAFVQQKSGDETAKVNFALKGMIEACGDTHITQSIDDIATVLMPNQKDATVLSALSHFEFRFVDMFKYFFSKHRPFMLYMKSSYSDMLKEQVAECNATSYVDITIDDSFKALTSEKPFIATAFQEFDEGDSLYDFWIHIIRAYQGYLMLMPDGTYQIGPQKQLFAAQNPDIDKYDKAFIKKIIMRHVNRYNTSLDVLNGIYKDAASQSVASNNSEQSTALFTTSHVTTHNFVSIFDRDSEFFGTQFMCDFSLERFTDIEFNGLPYTIDLYPHNQIDFTATNWLGYLGEEDFKVNCVCVEVLFTNLSEERFVLDLRDSKDLTDDKVLKLLAPQTDPSEAGIRPFLACRAKFICENDDSLAAHLPRYIPPKFPIKLQGVIVVPDDVGSKYDNKVPYMVFDGESTDAGTPDTDTKSSEEKTYALNNLPEHFLAYHVNLPIYKIAGAKQDVVVAAKYHPNLNTDQVFMPYVNQQAVEVDVFQEYAAITNALPCYSDNQYLDKSKQVNAITLGAEKQCLISFSDESSDEILLVKKTEKDSSTVKTLTMNNDGITLSFGDDSGGGG
ncbi:hypothetical protein AAEX28_14515 [Lentisphaerota bacterium WC36G]|nr:hypothetical protein LJT99_01270 [Lentisphaerae bacterium WC36]